MKKNKFLVVTYGILPIAAVSISQSSLAEEQLETINVEMCIRDSLQAMLGEQERDISLY